MKPARKSSSPTAPAAAPVDAATPLLRFVVIVNILSLVPFRIMLATWNLNNVFGMFSGFLTFYLLLGFLWVVVSLDSSPERKKSSAKMGIVLNLAIISMFFGIGIWWNLTVAPASSQPGSEGVILLDSSRRP